VGSKSNPSGTETYYTRNDSLLFAQTVHKYLTVATGLPDRGVRQANYHVTRESKMPAILLECGYLSNTKDESVLYTPDVQNKIAEAVVLGIKEYLGR
jgi:N-acetylmuramoyl-L-alanine amidase